MKNIIFRLLNIPDLHLYDKNISSTVDYKDECIRILEAVVSIVEKEELDAVVIGGDMYHGMLTKLDFYLETIKYIKRLKEKMDDNLLTIKGNHDISAKHSFTFYDLTVESLNLNRERTISYCNGNVVVNLFDYTDSISNLVRSRAEDCKVHIGIYHNFITPKGLMLNATDKVKFYPEDSNIFDNIDVAIINHIHAQGGLTECVVNGNKLKVLIPGSLNRISLSESHLRNNAFLPLVEVDDEFNVDAKFIEIGLTDIDEFFNIKKSLEIKKVAASFNEFSNKLESIKLSFDKPENDLEKLDIDEEIKQLGLYYLEMANKMEK